MMIVLITASSTAYLGQRTYGGLIDDGVKSGARYVLNNFFDGAKQDALDLLTGTYTISKGAAYVLISCYKGIHNAPHPCASLTIAHTEIAARPLHHGSRGDHANSELQCAQHSYRAGCPLPMR